MDGVTRDTASRRWAQYNPGFQWVGPWRLCPLGWIRPWAADNLVPVVGSCVTLTHRGNALVAPEVRRRG